MADEYNTAGGGEAAPKSTRTYTMSPLALAQRREAAQHSTGPVTEEGKAASSRNAWKHGDYSPVNQGALVAFSSTGHFGRPCVTTCPKHPENPNAPENACSLVLDGLTKAGGDCLDKEVYVKAFDSLLRSMETGEMESMHGVLAAEGAAALEIMHQIRRELSEHGVLMAQPILNKEGEAIMLPGKEGGEPEPLMRYVLNPMMGQYVKLLDKLGINLPQLLATPAARHRVADPEKAVDPVADVFQRILGRAGGNKPVIRGETVDAEFTEKPRA